MDDNFPGEGQQPGDRRGDLVSTPATSLPLSAAATRSRAGRGRRRAASRSPFGVDSVFSAGSRWTL
ncbi:hypothetical protein ACFWBV_08635 [Streptomyces sp. NPDC060030]|uniref:hypothetical protein n=1 Tax=Streptomyces sp. NPDC060030 TaxID=3347042 RepID=UPI00367FF0EC